MIELRRMDDYHTIQGKQGKTEWTNEELELIQTKRRILDQIIKDGTGDYPYELVDLPDELPEGLK